MAYEKPRSSANQIDKAAKCLVAPVRSDQDYLAGLQSLWNWRAAHSYPLNALHMTLRNRAKAIDLKSITVQRLRRYDSIISKLERNPGMQMSRMQDVGGCRANLNGPSRVRALVNAYDLRPIRHELKKITDYIAHPKPDGYRSVHMMYRFCGRATSLPWDGLRVEMQIRTAIQHSWATAVETVDTYTLQNLKGGSGREEWKRFFALVGSVHDIMEKSARVPDTPTDEQLLRIEVSDLEGSLNVIELLESLAQITKHFTGDRPRALGRDAHWYVLDMNIEQRKTRVFGYNATEFGKAKQRAAELEEKYASSVNQALLASADSMMQLKKAYPNYFADTKNFVIGLRRFLGR